VKKILSAKERENRGWSISQLAAIRRAHPLVSSFCRAFYTASYPLPQRYRSAISPGRIRYMVHFTSSSNCFFRFAMPHASDNVLREMKLRTLTSNAFHVVVACTWHCKRVYSKLNTCSAKRGIPGAVLHDLFIIWPRCTFL